MKAKRYTGFLLGILAMFAFVACDNYEFDGPVLHELDVTVEGLPKGATHSNYTYFAALPVETGLQFTVTTPANDQKASYLSYLAVDSVSQIPAGTVLLPTADKAPEFTGNWGKVSYAVDEATGKLVEPRTLVFDITPNTGDKARTYYFKIGNDVNFTKIRLYQAGQKTSATN